MTDQVIGFRADCESCAWYRTRSSKSLVETFARNHELIHSGLGDEHETSVKRIEGGSENG
jgi:hypothetical protein